MQQHLAVERLVAFIGNDQASGQGLPVEGDAVDEAEGVRPQRPGLVVEVRGTQAKVELDGQVGGGRVRRRLGRRLAQELPVGGAREAVLGELRGGGMVGSLAEDLFRETLR